MGKKKYLEQFKQQVMLLGVETVSELSKVAALNTENYVHTLTGLLDLMWEEARSNDCEEQYLFEIRKLWLTHIALLDIVRRHYVRMKYQKLLRHQEFHDDNLTAILELYGSATPDQNPLIELDERQQIYWQYLQFAKKIETAIMITDNYLSKETGIIPNFNDTGDSLIYGKEYSSRDLGDFMVEPKVRVTQERIRDVNEAKEFIYKKLGDVYKNANQDYFEWLVCSILYFEFRDIDVPKVDLKSLILPYECSKSELYKKIKLIKHEIYNQRNGPAYLGDVFFKSTMNFMDKRVLIPHRLAHKV